MAVLVGAGEGKLAGNALREVVKDWEAAVGERLLKEAMRRAKRKGADAEAEADIEAASRPELPAEGSAWALMTGSAAARTGGEWGWRGRERLEGDGGGPYTNSTHEQCA